MKILINLLLSVVLIAHCINSIAQPSFTGSKGTISGILVDKEDGVPVGFSNVVLYSTTDSVMVTWTISDEKGFFQLVKVPAGNYNVRINFIGYMNHDINNVSVGSKDPIVDLGKIELSKDAVALSEVNVVSFKNTYEIKSDKKVINVSNDINSTGGTAVDVLRNVPGLTVNADGAVILRGSDNISILVDGRPTSIDVTKLEQLSASEIESIELITNPSVKYNPEGKSGIINLKLKHKKDSGLSGNFMLSAGTGNKYTGSAGLNYNTGKFDFFAGFDGIRKDVSTSRYLLRESFFSDSPHFLQQNAKTNLNINSDKYKFGINIYLNPKNSITLSMSGNPSRKTDSDLTISQYFNKQMDPTYNILTLNAEHEREKSQDYIAGYKRTFDKKGEELTLDYVFTKNSGNILQPINYNYPDSTVNNEILMDSKSFNSNFQLNWILPIGKDARIENGIQSIVRGTEDKYLLNNNIAGIWIENVLLTNNFTYNEQIHSAYSLFTSKYQKFSISAGLRVEQTFIDGNQVITMEKISQKYFNLYPSFSLLDQLTENTRLQFSFSRRINRPNSRMINPFIDRSSPEVARSGNPLLKPEYVNSFEAGYTRMTGSTVLGFTLYYKKINDVINQLTLLDSSGVSHMYPQNMQSAETYGLETTFEHSFAKWWRINGNASFYRYIIKGGSEDNSNSNYSYNFRVNSNFYPMKKLSLQITGNYSGPVIGLYSKMKPQYSVDAAIKKNFLDDKLSLTLRASDIFNTLKNRYTSWGYNFNAVNWRKQESRVLYLSLSYTFGSGKSSKSSRSENNESAPVLEIF
jgi:outer membrane receptor protein involved in Fe transport